MRRTACWGAAALLSASLVSLPTAVQAVGPARAPSDCQSYTDPVYSGTMPTALDVLGFELGSQEVTTEEAYTYLDALDDASPDMSTGTFGTSGQGRPLRYAVIGDPVDVELAQEASAQLRDPSTTPVEAAEIARTAPAIAWMAGNVHGNEESGTDASLEVAYDVLDRTDCAATAIRDNTVLVIVPTQNPDGREMDTRRNSYGFDLNRDWFARTQSETDGKLELLRKFPPALLSDNHEMGGTSFFFPPNADPVHHEVADRSIGWINDLYGASMQDEFDRREWSYFNYSAYDLLYMGYGDTVPTTAYLGAAMTYEKGNASPIDERATQQKVATWTSLFQLATHRASVLKGIAANYRQALAEGKQGTLEPNEVFAPGHTVEREVPDEKVRSYFIVPTAGKAREVNDLVRRLQRMGVRVRQLTKPLTVNGYRPYGKPARKAKLPVGTYWISMAQAQKHWIQAMMGEDSYVPFPYFYDVTAWSGPLLFNVGAGRTGTIVRPTSKPVPALKPSAAPVRPRGARTVGLWETDESTSAYESTGWMRWLLDHKWKVPYRNLQTSDLAEGALAPIDTLIVPNGDADDTFDALGPDGRRALRQWLAAGGRLVSFRGGTELAARLQLTTARLSAPTSDIPGSLIRAKVKAGPLSKGVGGAVWSMFEYDDVMTVADPALAAVQYPRVKDPLWFVSGFAEGEQELAGTAVAVDEAYADGRVIAFAGDPNYRAFTDGTQKILWNAVYGADPKRKRAPGLQATLDRRRAAAQAARALPSYDDALVVTVRSAAAGRVTKALAARGLASTTAPARAGTTRILVPVRDGAGRDVARALMPRLRSLGDDVVALRAP